MDSETPLARLGDILPAGVQFEVNDRPVLGPQVIVPLSDEAYLSCIGEIDLGAVAQTAFDAAGHFPLRPGEVEVALVHHDTVREPLRHLPIERAVAVVQRALAGDWSDFE